MSDRTSALHGNPIPLEGPELKVGDTAPNATVRKDLGADLELSSFNGQARIYSVVPSLDTPVCALQTKRFNEEAANLPDVKFITISADLPVAQARFCGAENIDPAKVIFLSDHKDVDFGRTYGTLLPGLRILSRAVFVVDKNDTLQYVEYVPEISAHPDYDAVLAAAKAL
jgi:thiol peroxidase